MLTNLLGFLPKLWLAGIADIDFTGWLVGPEMRSAIAGLFASLWTAFASIFLNGLFGGM